MKILPDSDTCQCIGVTLFHQSKLDDECVEVEETGMSRCVIGS